MMIESTLLYRSMQARVLQIPSPSPELASAFDGLVRTIREESKYIVLLFPEYTPHDNTRHLDHLFVLADRILGTDLYDRLTPSELLLLGCGLYAHDWGMAVSKQEQILLESGVPAADVVLLANEPKAAKEFISNAIRTGYSRDNAWREYFRQTHGLRSGARLRRQLQPVGTIFADAVAKIAEGHTLDLREIRNSHRYPQALALFGETANLAALATYVRMVDLLDIGDDRTPYALWKFVGPSDPKSSTEWRKHRSLSPVAVHGDSPPRQLLVSGRTDDPSVFAALADLRSWIDGQFAESTAHLRMLPIRYALNLDSRIIWRVEADGFEPMNVRFEVDRGRILGFLARELYEHQPLAFVRELLQNSVDAIDARQAVLTGEQLSFNGHMSIRIRSNEAGFVLEWTDNGIGMDREVIATYFSQVGCSWYRSRTALELTTLKPLSQFGLGILSCFSVSSRMEVTTTSEPRLNRRRETLQIDIPSEVSHFRCRVLPEGAIGTTIKLYVSSAQEKNVSKEALASTLSKIARYVRHEIHLDIDGARTVIESMAPRKERQSPRRPASTVQGVSADVAEKLTALTIPITIELGDQDGDYYGTYSTVVPRKPADVRDIVRHRRVLLEGVELDFTDCIVDSEQSLFIKGVQAGSVLSDRRHQDHRDDGLALYGWTDWPAPRVLLDLRDPSAARFDLSRSNVKVTDDSVLTRAWAELAAKLRLEVFNWPIANPEDAALLLGACRVFGGVPDAGLEALLPVQERPILIIRAGRGAVWVRTSEFARANVFREAPFELGYAAMELPEFGAGSGLEGWQGEDMLFASSARQQTRRHPWLSSVVHFGCRSLWSTGWRPRRIDLVQGPSKEAVPLVCRVWTRDSVGEAVARTSDALQEDDDDEWRPTRGLYRDGPEALSFPPRIEKYAALGSRYWNRNHAKIVSIVDVMRTLADRRRQGRLSTASGRELAYYCSTDFYGYVVPSRYSGNRLAIEVPNLVLDIAERENLGRVERLTMSDFVPGSVGEYSNPYQFDVGAWKGLDTGLGMNI